jgi:hypothetical protein
MVGTKHRSKYRKKRKGKPFPGVPKWSKRREETPLGHNENADVNTTPSTSSHDQIHGLSASRKKLKDRGFVDESSESCYGEDEDFIGHGYRLLDLENVSTTFSSIHGCEEGKQYFAYNPVIIVTHEQLICSYIKLRL